MFRNWICTCNTAHLAPEVQNLHDHAQNPCIRFGIARRLSWIFALALLFMSWASASATINSPLNPTSTHAYYGAPYFVLYACGGDPPHASVGEAIDAWWEHYKPCYAYAFPGCSYQLTVYPDGPETNTFAGMLLQGTCGGGQGVFGTYYPYKPGKNDGGCCHGVGDPINIGTGNEFLDERDFELGKLSFRRYYNSHPSVASGHVGVNWRHSFDRSIAVVDDGTNAVATWFQADGRQLDFVKNANGWLADSDVADSLSKLLDSSGNFTGWLVSIAADRSYETYDTQGKLIAIRDANGLVTNLVYSDATTSVLIAPAAGLLIAVTDPQGRSLSFAYDGSSRLSSLITPLGTVYSYGYDSVSNLDHVTYQGITGTSTRQYHYNESTLTSGASLPNAVTGITDENAVRYATIGYDSQGRGISSFNGSNSNPTNVGYNTDGTTTVIYASGVTVNWGFSVTSGTVRASSANIPCTPMCNSSFTSRAFDSSGYPQSNTDFDGNHTNYTYDDTRGLETQRVEAAGSSAQRTTNTTWNPGFRGPDQRSVLNASGVTESLTKWSYNTRGQPLSRCSIDPAVSGASSYTCGASTNAPTGVRQSRYTYCESAGVTAGTCPIIGLMLSVDGARTDVSDITTYTYRQSDDPTCATSGACAYRHGDLWKVTDALGHVTETMSYDKNGRATRMKDANGVITDMTYHPRGWLLTRTVRANADGSANATLDAITSFAYDNVGNVTRTTQADGAYLAYSYDAAHRLTDITDNLSNRIHYTLDAAGNRIKEDTYDASYDPAHPNLNIKREMARVYDQLNRLVAAKNASGAAVATYVNPSDAAPTYIDGYDGNGNAIYSVDGLGAGTEQQYDPLNRLIKTLQDHTGQTASTHDTTTQYAYDARDNLRSVTDPDNLTTGYTYDGLNNLTALSSPDTGSTGYTYDAAGNRLTQTDARGVLSSYSYDALNRLIGITYPTGSLNVSYAYDESDDITSCGASYPIGRLTTMTDSSGSTTYCYDQRGNVFGKTQRTADTTGSFWTQYQYTLADRLKSITYPSGAVVTYGRDSVGRINAVSYRTNAVATAIPILSNVSYSPFGPVNTLTFGNGRTLTKSYDQDYAIDKVVSSGSGGLVLDASVDVLGNIINASSTVGATPPTQTYLYDPLYRLTTVENSSASAVAAFSYDGTGDRLSKTQGGTPESYTYTAGTHRLASVAGVSRNADPNGNTTQIGTQTLAYDDRNRLTAGHAAGIATFDYSGRGERVLKNAPRQQQGAGLPTGAMSYTYLENGALSGEYTAYLQCINNTTNAKSGALTKVTSGSIAVVQLCPPNWVTTTTWTPSTDYIYLDNLPIAMVKGGQLYYVETDHLGTPREVIQPGTTTASDTLVWKWDYFASNSAFGENAPSPQTVTMNLRFPGQYFDAETGLNYNYFRDYEPGTGRYVESDPIGLKGGNNTYGYAKEDPLKYFDRLGLYGSRYYDPPDYYPPPPNPMGRAVCEAVCALARGVRLAEFAYWLDIGLITPPEFLDLVAKDAPVFSQCIANCRRICP
jgi:RHS repeat-associated protein